MASCPYVPPTLLAPFSLPLMRALASYLPDRSLCEARSVTKVKIAGVLAVARELACLYILQPNVRAQAEHSAVLKGLILLYLWLAALQDTQHTLAPSDAQAG